MFNSTQVEIIKEVNREMIKRAMKNHEEQVTVHGYLMAILFFLFILICLLINDYILILITNV